MDAITYTTARAHLAETMDRVCNDHEAVIITRKEHPSVVLLSLTEYDLLVEKTKQVSANPGTGKSEIKPAPNASREAPFQGVEPSRIRRELPFNDYN